MMWTITIKHFWSGHLFQVKHILFRKFFHEYLIDNYIYIYIYIITKSPPEQSFKSKIKITEIREEIKLLNDYENAIIVFWRFFRIIK